VDSHIIKDMIIFTKPGSCLSACPPMTFYVNLANREEKRRWSEELLLRIKVAEWTEANFLHPNEDLVRILRLSSISTATKTDCFDPQLGLVQLDWIHQILTLTALRSSKVSKHISK
jgi:hypothetical protein